MEQCFQSDWFVLFSDDKKNSEKEFIKKEGKFYSPAPDDFLLNKK